ncbi:MAG: PQQ-dependent sugar dehydrogenase [Armatimonadota bacterium]
MIARRFYTGYLACCLLLMTAGSCAQPRQTVKQPPQAAKKTQATDQASPATNASFSPRRVAFSTAMLQRLRVPAGFQVNVFAQGVTDARIIVAGPGNVVYVSQPDLGQVTALWDRNRDGRADTQRAVVSGISRVHGLTIRGNQLYLSPPTRVYVADINADGTVGRPRVFINNLPPGGNHGNRTLAFGPDGLLYISVGSSCNACVERNPEHATMLQVRADGSGRRVFARGLRNTIGFAWHPVTDQLWGMDQGSDFRGPNNPPEELNRIIDGRHYGWPWCYGKRQIDEATPGQPSSTTKAQFCPTTEPSVLEYQAHSSPIQLAFYTGTQFPAAFRNDAFLTFHGSWNRQPSVGYKVVRIRFDANGRPTGFEDFLTGFLTDNGTAQFGRPAGLAVMPDGSLLIGDDGNGVIYRVSYRG